jgi:steroid delta-isomerase-like uncharacterized protein
MMAADQSKRGASERDEGQKAMGQSVRTGGEGSTREREQRISTTREGGEARGRSSVEENGQLARRVLDLWNTRDFDRAASFVADNAECVNVAFNTTFRGPEGYREFMQSWATAFPDGRIEIKRVIADENGAAVEYTGRGTNTGPLTGPMGTIQATGRQGELALCDVLEIERGKIRRLRSYFDSATLMRQLGIMEEGVGGKATGGGK